MDHPQLRVNITCRSRRDEEFPIHPFQALNRDFRLLAHYLRPQWPWMGLLAVILCSTICVQVITLLVASRFIDQATSGGDLRDLIVLAGLAMGQPWQDNAWLSPKPTWLKM